MNKKTSYGTFLCIGAAALFGAVPTFLRTLLLSGVSQAACVIIPCIESIAICVLLCLHRHMRLFPGVKRTAQFILCGALGLGATPLLLTGAYRLIPTGAAIVIHFLYPTLVAVVCLIQSRHWPSPSLLCAAFLSVAGIAFTSLESGFFSSNSPVGCLCAFASAFSYCAFIIGSERLQDGSTSTLTALVYINIGGLLAGLLWSTTGNGISLPWSSSLWSISLGHGIVELICYYLLNRGIRYAGAVTASFATLIEPLTAIALGALLFDEPVTIQTSAGAIMVLSAVWLSVTSPVRAVSKVIFWMIVMNKQAGKRQGITESLSDGFNTKFSPSVMRRRARPLSYR